MLSPARAPEQRAELLEQVPEYHSAPYEGASARIRFLADDSDTEPTARWPEPPLQIADISTPKGASERSDPQFRNFRFAGALWPLKTSVARLGLIGAALVFAYFCRDGARDPSGALLTMPFPRYAKSTMTRVFWAPAKSTHEVLIDFPGCTNAPSRIRATWRLIEKEGSVITGGSVDLENKLCDYPQRLTLGSFVAEDAAAYRVAVDFEENLTSLGADNPVLIVR